MTLREVFERAKRRDLPGVWLCLPSSPWTLETDGVFVDCEGPLPRSSNGEELEETLDDKTIEEVVDWADRLADNENDSARLEVFHYYHRFDAFPKKLGDPEPPPADQILHQIDLQFYDSLGPEAPQTKCRKDGCSRGTVKFSVFCRSHHFESVKRKPCPFQH
jgi:hypothetical protein